MSASVNEKLPQECTNLAEVRNEIDNLDKEIIRLISTRGEYVREVVKYKDGTPAGIEASERRAAVIETRKQWGEEYGLGSEMIGDIYERLVRYFIEEEKKIANIK